MNIHMLDEQVSVSGQINANDIVLLVEQGVEIVVCNRPDNESDDQPDYTEIEAAAQTKGVEIVNIPFTAGEMQENQIEQFAALIKTNKRIHAYCRSGNRSSQLWSAARKIAP